MVLAETPVVPKIQAASRETLEITSTARELAPAAVAQMAANELAQLVGSGT
jgi:hypothetical protein